MQGSNANNTHDKNEDSDIALIGSFETGHKDEWILDSGCTYYICYVKKYFSSLEELEGGVIYMGSDIIYKIKGIG